MEGGCLNGGCFKKGGQAFRPPPDAPLPMLNVPPHVVHFLADSTRASSPRDADPSDLTEWSLFRTLPIRTRICVVVGGVCGLLVLILMAAAEGSSYPKLDSEAETFACLCNAPGQLPANCGVRTGQAEALSEWRGWASTAANLCWSALFFFLIGCMAPFLAGNCCACDGLASCPGCYTGRVTASAVSLSAACVGFVAVVPWIPVVGAAEGRWAACRTVGKNDAIPPGSFAAAGVLGAAACWAASLFAHLSATNPEALRRRFASASPRAAYAVGSPTSRAPRTFDVEQPNAGPAPAPAAPPLHGSGSVSLGDVTNVAGGARHPAPRKGEAEAGGGGNRTETRPDGPRRNASSRPAMPLRGGWDGPAQSGASHAHAGDGYDDLSRPSLSSGPSVAGPPPRTVMPALLLGLAEPEGDAGAASVPWPSVRPHPMAPNAGHLSSGSIGTRHSHRASSVSVSGAMEEGREGAYAASVSGRGREATAGVGAGGAGAGAGAGVDGHYAGGTAAGKALARFLSRKQGNQPDLYE